MPVEVKFGGGDQSRNEGSVRALSVSRSQGGSVVQAMPAYPLALDHRGQRLSQRRSGVQAMPETVVALQRRFRSAGGVSRTSRRLATKVQECRRCREVESQLATEVQECR